MCKRINDPEITNRAINRQVGVSRKDRTWESLSLKYITVCKQLSVKGRLQLDGDISGDFNIDNISGPITIAKTTFLGDITTTVDLAPIIAANVPVPASRTYLVRATVRDPANAEGGSIEYQGSAYVDGTNTITLVGPSVYLKALPAGLEDIEIAPAVVPGGIDINFIGIVGRTINWTYTITYL